MRALMGSTTFEDVETWLGVPQCRESNDLKFPSAAPPTGYLLFSVPPYSAMAAGHVVELIIDQIVGDQGSEVFNGVFRVEDSNMGLPMTWSVPYSIFDRPTVWKIESRIKILMAEGHPVSGPSQAMTKAEVPAFELPPLHIAGLDDVALEWNPAEFLEGARLRFSSGDHGSSAPFEAGDDLMVLFTPEDGDSVSLHLRLDETSVLTGSAWLHMPFEALVKLNGQTLDICWQWARQGAARRSESRVLRVLDYEDVAPPGPGELLAPIIQGAIEEPDADGLPKGFLVTDYQGPHVQVRIPDEVELEDDDVLSLLWQGYPGLGEGEFAPRGDGRTFQVPSQLLAANMARRLPVLYVLERYESKAYDLRIMDVPGRRYPVIQPSPPVLRYLSLASVPAEGATFIVREWVFYAEKQPVKVTVRGGGGTHILRDGTPLSVAEFSSKQVAVKVEKSWLTSLGAGSTLTIDVGVSFDGGESFKSFQSLELIVRD